jgi:hypothetical protein
LCAGERKKKKNMKGRKKKIREGDKEGQKNKGGKIKSQR